MDLEENKVEQLAIIALSFDDRLVLAKSLKRACKLTDNIDEKRYYKTRIRELFTQEEWDELCRKNNK